MNLLKIIGTICAVLVVSASGSAYARNVTCDECEMDKGKRSDIQQDLDRKQRQLEKAFKKREFGTVRELRKEITELRRELLKLKSREPACKIACRSDVVKAAKCKKLVGEIVELDKDDPTGKEDLETIDKKYAELAACNRELKKLKKMHLR